MSIVEDLNERSKGTLPGLIGLEFTEASEGLVRARIDLRSELMAPNGYLHAATVIALGKRKEDRRLPMHANGALSAVRLRRLYSCTASKPLRRTMPP